MSTWASNTSWYKGSIPMYQISEINIVNNYIVTGNEKESWDASSALDESIMCYRIDTTLVIVCNNLTVINDKMFTRFLSLEKITGLSHVTTIGSRAFCLTPKLTHIDINPSILTSIGESAFKMSGAEDYLNLSNISLDIIGDKATRRKRWSDERLTAIKNTTFPMTILLEVPNMDCQILYPDVLYGIKNDSTPVYGDRGCASFAYYHAWNHLFANTDKQYDNWLEWYNNTINADGSFAENNDMSTPTMLNSLIATRLGWTFTEIKYVDTEEQLVYILNRLSNGFPVIATIHSNNTVDGKHSIIIVGCDANTHKLAVIDSAATDDIGVMYWVAFEDIFIGGTSETDRISIVGYNHPILASTNTWFSQGGTNVSKSSITSVEIKDSYVPSETVTSSWDASAAKDGSVMAYVEGTKLTLAGNNTGKIYANPDSTSLFNGFGNLEIIRGGSLLDTSNATTLARMFQACFALEYVNTSNWDTHNVTLMNAMFQGATSIGNLDVSGWDVSKVTDFTSFLNMPGNYLNTNLTTLDVSNWDVSEATTFYLMFNKCCGLTKIDTTNWDVSSVTNMQMMFGHCINLTTIGNTANWNTSAATNFKNMFLNCSALNNLNVSKWNTSSVTDMSYMFRGCTSLESLDVSNWDVSNVTTMKSMFDCSNDYGQTPIKIQELDVSKWDTSSTTDMSAMFYGCKGPGAIDVSGWDVSKVTTFDHMFAHSYLTIGDTSNWKVSTACTILNALFHTVQNTTLNVSNFNTSNVTSFAQMFEFCDELTEIIGLENFNTSAGLGFAEMFNGCSSLKELNLSSFNTTKAKDGAFSSANGSTSKTLKNMFTGMTSLEKITLGANFSFNGDGTTSDATHAAVLPTPSSDYIEGADGNWYTVDGDVYITAAIPTLTANTYYADSKACKDYLIKGATLIDLGRTIRKKANMNNKLTPYNMENAVNSVSIIASGDSDGNVTLDISGFLVSEINGNVIID